MNEGWMLVLGGGLGVAIVAAIKELIMWLLNRRVNTADREQEEPLTKVLNKLDDMSRKIDGLQGQLDEFKIQQDDLSLAQREAMCERIAYLCCHAIREKEIDSKELSTLTRMHTAYHKLGGIGYLDDLMARVRALPLK